LAVFAGFARRRIATSGAEINLVTGGSGPPLLLLHGYPPDMAQIGALREPARLEPEAFAEYLRCFENPETIRAIQPGRLPEG
jgi:hypothetical protein